MNALQQRYEETKRNIRGKSIQVNDLYLPTSEI
jgi:hypothetical protein